jgi:signal transduction histidine kinase
MAVTNSTVPPTRHPVAHGTALLMPAAPAGLNIWKMVGIALLAGLVVFVIGAGLDWLLVREHESRRLTIEISDTLAAVVAGALVFRLLQYEHERRRRLRQKLEVIAEMNHHIRNALQVISLSAASSGDQRQLDAIRDSMNRIQWALREILPKL